MLRLSTHTGFYRTHRLEPAAVEAEPSRAFSPAVPPTGFVGNFCVDCSVGGDFAIFSLGFTVLSSAVFVAPFSACLRTDEGVFAGDRGSYISVGSDTLSVSHSFVVSVVNKAPIHSTEGSFVDSSGRIFVTAGSMAGVSSAEDAATYVIGRGMIPSANREFLPFGWRDTIHPIVKEDTPFVGKVIFSAIDMNTTNFKEIGSAASACGNSIASGNPTVLPFADRKIRHKTEIGTAVSESWGVEDGSRTEHRLSLYRISTDHNTAHSFGDTIPARVNHYISFCPLTPERA